MNPTLWFLLLVLSNFSLMAQASEPLYKTNGKIYDQLWQKIPETDWNLDLLKKRLTPHEFDFLVVSMYYGVRSNGGSFHALTCFENELTEYIAACKRVKAVKTATTLEWGQKRLLELRASKAPAEEKTAIEAKLEMEYEELDEENDEELDVLLNAHVKTAQTNK